MQTPKLLIRKGMVVIQGRSRPCIQVLAIVNPVVKAKLEEHFLTENLFKRSAYSNGFPAGTPEPQPSLAPHLAALLKSDACPEVTVKTLLAGQLFQAQSIWEMKAFEYIAQRAFDSFIDFATSVMELGREMAYVPAQAQRLADTAAFAADMAADRAAAAASAALPAAVAPGSEGVADAA
jgi:hypothetical protein